MITNLSYIISVVYLTEILKDANRKLATVIFCCLNSNKFHEKLK